MSKIGLINQQQFNHKISFDLLGLYLLLVFLVLNPFHFILYDKIVYYREFFSVLFIMLICQKLYSYTTHVFQNELGIVIFFPLLLLLFSFFDQGKDLYGIDITSASKHLISVSPILYVLRNAFLYLPMVLYFAFRGLSELEIKKIALIIVITSPIAVGVFLNIKHLATIKTFGSLILLAGAGLDYNTFVPYLTFASLSAIYLISIKNISFVIRLLSFFILIFLSVYILLTTSRQSLLFVLICGFVFFVKNTDLSWIKKVTILLLYLFFTLSTFYALTYHFFGNDHGWFAKCASASGLVNTPRLQLAKEGLLLLQPHEYITGAGLTSVISSGPHNDFIRWIQRIGLIGMLIGFYPFIRALSRLSQVESNFRKMDKNNSLILYLFLAVIFTVYHSLFGYPREDAFQAVYCFLSLAMWYGVGEKFVSEAIKNPLSDTKTFPTLKLNEDTVF